MASLGVRRSGIPSHSWVTVDSDNILCISVLKNLKENILHFVYFYHKEMLTVGRDVCVCVL